MKVAFHTLGCKVNQNDSSNLMVLFRERGYEIVPFEAAADIYVINTCAVTQVGERKSRQMIRKAIGANPEAVIAVTGCYAQTAPQELAGIPGINLVIGMADRHRIVDLVEEFRQTRRNMVRVSATAELTAWQDLPVGAAGERTRATLKIEEGCDQFCSYCIVPYARGRVRSMPLDQVVEKLWALADQGYQEVVLTGIHLGSYGKDLNRTLEQLLREIVKLPGNFRIRLGSIDPHEIDGDLIDTIVNNQRICQFLHIPLQSGSSRILQLMNRHYTCEEYAELLKVLREKNPLIAIGTDLIVGFPGETERDFNEMASYVRDQAFSRIHVFRYSPRKGTPASKMPGRIPAPEQEIRSRRIQEIGNRSAAEFARQFIGRTVEVLFEEREGSQWHGWSGEYLRVNVESKSDLKNKLILVKIEGAEEGVLRGTC
jgi:threonylcarbamoyladenosine tRNA methylthiotransferase MtaB